MAALARHLALAGALMALTASPLAAADLKGFGWLAGAWSSEAGEGWTEERWAPARGGVMMGTSLSGKRGRASEFEFMRLTEDADGGVSLWASPGGKATTRFRLVGSSANGAVFENLKHDYPTRIEYRRRGRSLVATISGPGGKDARRWTYWRK